ncbi:MAG: hypothetical protein OXF31_09125 [Gammaproteobacteria bacterium]|nr:hypothetical protein [Gammaproteobacteria bacterium]
MAINIAHRSDLDARVEALAVRLGLSGKGRKTRIIERALCALESEVEAQRPSKEEMEEEFRRIEEVSADLRKGLLEMYPDHDPNNLSLSLQEELYDERGLPT